MSLIAWEAELPLGISTSRSAGVYRRTESILSSRGLNAVNLTTPQAYLIPCFALAKVITDFPLFTKNISP